MKILVAVKRVVDYNVKIRVKADHTGVDTANVKMSINPFDEIAIEEAIRMKEAGIVDNVTIISVGSLQSKDTIKHGLAMGADRGILVLTEEELDSLAIAKLLKQLALNENPDLIILGKQAIDDDCNQTGQMLAALLDWPQGTFISKIELENQYAVVVREIDDGLETIKLQLPAIVTTDLRLNEPRYLKLPDIMRAKKKPLTVVSVKDLNVDVTPHVTTLEVTEPAKRSSGIRVNSVDELVDKLRNEAKVIQ